MPASGYEFYILCSTRHLTRLLRSLVRYRVLTLEDKIRIHTRACNILYFFFSFFKSLEGIEKKLDRVDLKNYCFSSSFNFPSP